MNAADVFFAAAQAGGTITTVAVIFGPGLLAAAGWAAGRAILRAHYRRIDNRAAAIALAQQARIDDINNRLARAVPAADDNQAGVDRALRNACELLYRQPAWTEENR